MIKVVIKKKIKQNVLKEALADLSKELINLKKEKQAFIRKIDTLETSIQSTQFKETTLRDRITKLIAAESELSKKKSNSITKINSLKEKISKLKKVKEDLSDI
ncbi:hypothetical protein HON86_02930 [Candidatus Woesearchaeota archaeon]|jgi:chromosome segregation ATPase|nr:hypothetical protein [Candidatus Woesearchaeota archaeon]MBT6734965.1 hypothetical protein [Candidatus Woesearchaeota archaeon]MBT7474814.1 hypothetical protein [Candidatus Woesearchaeota archaeon]